MAGALMFHILGPLEVHRADGTLVDLGGPQPRLVLGRLLMAEGWVVATSLLLDALWGENPPDSANGTLQTYISRLRRALGPDGARMLRYEGMGYRLDVPPEQVDARRFEELAIEGSRLLAQGKAADAADMLQNALRLWSSQVPGDDPGLSPRWEERRLTAQEDLFDAALQLGRTSLVVADLTDAVTRHPLRERSRGLLALALYRSGRQADALAVLDEGRRILGDELGLDLSRELRDLRSRILDQDRALDRAPAAAVSPRPGGPSTAAAAAPPGSGSPDPQRGILITEADPERQGDAFIGRVPELSTLRTVLREAFGGAGWRSVVIEGEPGIGKTALAQRLLREAEAAGARTLAVGTLETGAAPAYGPWIQLVRAARQRYRELPATAGQLINEATESASSAALVAAALADSVAELLTALAADRGVVVLLEDLQWADPASLDLLSGLAPRVGRAPVLFVVTVRELEVGRADAVVETLAQLTRHAGTRRVLLHGLSWSESRDLIRLAAHDVPDSLVTVVHSRSDGNPFFTTELARMMGEEAELTSSDSTAQRLVPVPSGVRDVLQRRVSRLPANTRTLLEVAAVLGREVDVTLLAAVSGEPLDDCLDDLEPALVARLLDMPSAAPGTLRFAHALVREALAEGMSSLRRARLHLRAADGILAAVGDNDDTAEIVAEHLWHAAAVGASARAAEALEHAAQVALKRQALASAESLLTRAAGLYRAASTQGGRAELRVLRQLGFVGAALHGYPVNADSPLIRRARELARSTGQVSVLLDLIRADWAGFDTGGEPVRAEHLVEEAEALVQDAPDPLLQSAVAAMRGFSERHFGRMANAYLQTDHAVRLFPTAAGSEEAGYYLVGFITALGYREWARTFVQGLDRASLEQQFHNQDVAFGRTVISLFGAAATMAAGDEPGLKLFAHRMMAADPDMTLPFWSALAELYTAVSLLQGGDVTTGLERFRAGQDRLRQSGGRTMLAGIFAAAAQALGRTGLFEDAKRLLAAARAELAETAELAYAPLVDLADAQILAAEGDLPAAAHLFDLARETAVRHGSFGIVRRIDSERATLGGQPGVQDAATG